MKKSKKYVPKTASSEYDCKQAEYDLTELTRDYALAKLSEIQIGKPTLSDEDEDWHFNSDWCNDVKCEIKDKCHRSKKNLKVLGPLLDPETKEHSKKYFDDYQSKIEKTTDLGTLKLVEDVSNKCADIRSLYQEFCKLRTIDPPTPSQTSYEGDLYFGDKSHAFQIYRFKKMAKESRDKINKNKSPGKKTPRRTPLRKTTRANNKNRKNFSSVHRSVARNEQRRREQKRNNK